MSRRTSIFFTLSLHDALPIYAILPMIRPQVTIRPVSRYPVVERDLALIISEDITFSEISKEVERQGKGLIKNISLFDVYENEEQLGEGKRSYGIKMLFSDTRKTLSDKEVDVVVEKILKGLSDKYGIYLR